MTTITCKRCGEDKPEAVTARLLLSKSDVARIAEWVRS